MTYNTGDMIACDHMLKFVNTEQDHSLVDKHDQKNASKNEIPISIIYFCR